MLFHLINPSWGDLAQFFMPDVYLHCARRAHEKNADCGDGCGFPVFALALGPFAVLAGERLV